MSNPLLQSDTRSDLLKLIKRRGEVSLDHAAEATGLSRSTLRQHLVILEQLGLVRRSTIRHGRGRPGLRFSLTHDGARLFPELDSKLLGALLHFLESQGRGDLTEAFFRNYWDDRWRDVEGRLAGDGAPDDDRARRLEVIERTLREQGFMPEFHHNGPSLTIRECNCPFPEAVKQTRLPCKLEAEFLQRVVGRRLERVAYIPDGSPACTYEFTG